MDEVIITLTWHEIFLGVVIIVLVILLAVCLTKYLKEKREKNQLIKLYKEEQEAATTDPLTGLYNRRFLDQRLDEEIARANRYGHDLQVMFIDLDDFKQVNDTFGHKTGDAVLKEVTDNLRKIIRSSDIAVRPGGDEFVLILPETSLEPAMLMAKRIGEAIRNIKIQDGAMNISASIGVHKVDRDNPTDDPIEAASVAMYAAKNGGKSAISISKKR